MVVMTTTPPFINSIYGAVMHNNDNVFRSFPSRTELVCPPHVLCTLFDFYARVSRRAVILFFSYAEAVVRNKQKHFFKKQ